ncbi:hypothetical protein F5Y05DRAFT_136297 [Hypoxylon sp. FL0543]|nr:hypothetical protein F5Y05DRAFT_136297 [Hypoxylon sp. FL0543]
MDLLLDSQRGNYACSSIREIQDKLHHSLVSKSSNTRAEHTSITFELRYNTILHINQDAENGSPDGAVEPNSQMQQQPVTRSVNVSETVQNQPPDDPVLQRAVAKHIVSEMGAVEGRTWTVRNVSKDAQGWTFTYICKDSLQAWNRANAKNAGKAAIGSYSGPGALDPINASRPAFDCRGTLTIAFSKSARSIIVKYNHTPIHKTVTELIELLAPTLPPAPTANGKANSHRTPKAKRPRPAEGEEGSRRKRPKKKGKAPEAPMEGPPGGEVQPDQNGAESQSINSDAVQLTSNLNVPPAEKARRERKASELLAEKGIDLATLSEEQFSIFANQAPDLQAISLDLLVRFGAEKLRIVHPSEADNPSSPNSTPVTGVSTNATPATTAGPTATPGTAETPTKKRRPRKKKSDGPVTEVPIGDGAVVPVEQNGEVGTTTSTLRPTVRKTRGSCETCKKKKTKCTKEHPSCAICRDAGVECIYLPPKPRSRKSAITAEVAEIEDSDVPGESEQWQAQVGALATTAVSAMPAAPEPTEGPEGPEVPDTPEPVDRPVHPIAPPPPDPDNEEFIPDPNILSGPVEHQLATTQPPPQPPTQYYQDQSTGFTFPQDSQPSMTGLTFPESQTRETQFQSSPNLPFPSTSTPHQAENPSGLTFPQPASTATQQRRTTSTSGRRSLPTSPNKQTPVPTPVIHHVPAWNASPTIGQATRASPTLAKQQEAKRSKPRKSASSISQQAQDGMNQATALSQAAVAKASQPLPVSGSPYQNAARAHSRQGHRSQSGTPVSSTSRPPPQAPQAAVSSSYPTTSSASVPSYDPYARYDNSTNSQYDSATNDHGSSRISYEPGSYHPNPSVTTSASYSSAPAYDYSQAARPTNPLSQALNSSAGYSNSNVSTTAQWATSQTRGAQQQNQSHPNSTYPVVSAASTPHNYGTRSTDSRTSHQRASYNQPQSQSYGSFPAQQSSSNQQAQQNWYGFNAANSNSSTNQNGYSNNRNSGYSGATTSGQTTFSSQRSTAANYTGHSYGSGTDDQALYELLRAGNSAH